MLDVGARVENLEKKSKPILCGRNELLRLRIHQLQRAKDEEEVEEVHPSVDVRVWVDGFLQVPLLR